MLDKSIIEKISKVPPLPDSIIKIESLFTQEDPSMQELVNIIKEDPVLTADLLGLANSSLYAFRKNIISVQQVITLFGMKNIRGFILSSIAKQSFEADMSPYGITNKEFQDISLIQSTLMFQWFMTIDIQQSGILVPLTFLMDIGKIIIAKEVDESGKKEEFLQAIKECDSIPEVEKKFTGMTSAEVTALLFTHWNFNEIFENVIKHSDEPYYSDEEYKVFTQAVDVVKTCINVKGVISEENFKAAKMKALEYGLSIASFIKTVQRIEEKISKK